MIKATFSGPSNPAPGAPRVNIPAVPRPAVNVPQIARSPLPVSLPAAPALPTAASVAHAMPHPAQAQGHAYGREAVSGPPVTAANALLRQLIAAKDREVEKIMQKPRAIGHVVTGPAQFTQQQVLRQAPVAPPTNPRPILPQPIVQHAQQWGARPAPTVVAARPRFVPSLYPSKQDGNAPPAPPPEPPKPESK